MRGSTASIRSSLLKIGEDLLGTIGVAVDGDDVEQLQLIDLAKVLQ